MNDNRRNLGGLNVTLNNTDPNSQICDETGIDSVNSQRVEKMIFKDFLDDNMLKISSNYPAAAIKPTSTAFLTSRVGYSYMHIIAPNTV